MKNILDYFFKPKSVAIIGASNNKMSWGNWVSQNILAYKMQNRGEVYFINKKGNDVLGEPAYYSISDIPGTIDFAVIIVPNNKVPEILEECGKKRVKVCTVITGGYSEIPKEESIEGYKFQDQLIKIKEKYNIKVQGPNCNGFYNVKCGINVSSMPNKFLIDSPVALITQSGYIGQALSYWGFGRKYTFGKYISTGNELDLTVTDYIEYFGNDPSVKVICVYIEGLKDGMRFKKVCQEVVKRKPILIWKTSDHEDVSRAAKSHTGKLVGNKQVFDSVVNQIRLFQTKYVEHFLPVSFGLIKHPPLLGKKIGIMTFGAGFGVILTNAIVDNGFVVPEFSQNIKLKLRKIIKTIRASVKNPVDIGASGTYTQDVYLRTARVLLKSNEIDCLIVTNLGENGLVVEEGHELEDYIAQKLQEYEINYNKPILLFTILTSFDSKSVKNIESRGPVYHRVNDLIETLKALYFYNFYRH